MISPNWCTTNFLFNTTGAFDGGPYFLGTAKHCVQTQGPGEIDPESGSVTLQRFDSDEDVIGKPVVLVIAKWGFNRLIAVEVGQVAYTTAGGSQIGHDYALIRVYGHLEGMLSPSTALVGGPASKSRTPSASGSAPLLMVGHGVGVGSGGTPRTGLLTASSIPHRPNGYGMIFPVANGDSGAPVQTLNGEPVGNLTHLGISGTASGISVAFGTKVSLVEQLWGLRVVTCSSPAPWPFPGCPV